MELKIKTETAKKLYPESPEWFREVLEESFGKECFFKRFDDIKTFDDACRACGTTEEEFNKKWEKLGLPADTLNYEKAKIVARAINQGWTPDWNDTNQRKWWPWFKMSSSFSFSYSNYDYDNAITDVGSRLCFETEEKSDYAAKQFIDIYKALLT